MADEVANTANQPVFQIQRMYLKDMSLEQPNSPQILLEQDQPSVDINISIEQAQVADGIYEVCLTGTVTTKLKDRTLFLIEAKQAGIFELRNIPNEQVGPVLGITCSQIVYPYLRANISDIITRAGFPPVVLNELNFQAIYEAQQQPAPDATKQ